MWSLQNLLRVGIKPGGSDESSGKVRQMLRSALSIDNDDILMDALMALQEWSKMASDEEIRTMYNSWVIERLVALL